MSQPDSKPATSELPPPDLDVFREGFTADWTVIARLIAIESRGCRVTLSQPDRLHITHRGFLTAADETFLRARHAEACTVVAYCEHLAKEQA